MVDAASGAELGHVPAVELVTVGQRRGLGPIQAAGAGVGPEEGRGEAQTGPSAGMGGPAGPAGRQRRYVVGVDVGAGTVSVGRHEDLLVRRLAVSDLSWVDGHSPLSPGRPVDVQCSAHGSPVRGALGDGGTIELEEPQRRVAPGQSVVFYDGEVVLGAGVAD